MKLPRITEIIKVKPFKITCKWSTGEILVTDFEIFFEKWKHETNQLLMVLSDYQKFKYVSISESNTLQWVNINLSAKHFDGTIKTYPLDLCPDVLYSTSQPLKKYKLVPEEVEELEEILSY